VNAPVPSPRPTAEELDRLLTSDGDDPDGTTALALPTVPAGAPILRMLRREVEAAARNEPPGSPLQGALHRVLRGELDLRGLLADPAFPKPPERPEPALVSYLEDLKEDPR
jgi:hypothetical protein